MPQSPSHFPSTCWTRFQKILSETPVESQRALNEICSAYWKPLHTYALSIGCAHQDAEDCVQGFLSKVSAPGFFSDSDSEKGKMRSFLLVSFKRYIYDVWKKQKALKRGGGVEVVSLEDSRDHPIIVDPALAYDQQWAMLIVEQAKEALQQRYHSQGNDLLHQALEPYLDGAPLRQPETLATQLGMSVSALKAAAHRHRKRFGTAIHFAVAETVSDPSEVEGELQLLIQILGK